MIFLVVGVLLVLCAVAGVLRRPCVLYVDPVRGTDATARRGDFRRPFRTIQAAMDATRDGDQVLCAPGEHVVTSTVFVGPRRHLILRGVITTRNE